MRGSSRTRVQNSLVRGPGNSQFISPLQLRIQRFSPIDFSKRFLPQAIKPKSARASTQQHNDGVVPPTEWTPSVDYAEDLKARCHAREPRKAGSPAVPLWRSLWIARLDQPVHGASLAFLRIAFGCLMFLETRSLQAPSPITNQHIPLETYFSGFDLKFSLPYAWFSWVPMLPPQGFEVLCGVLSICSLSVALGFVFRLSSLGLFLSWGYLFVVESTRTYWQSHYYLELLIAGLLVLTPAAKAASVDGWLRRRSKPDRRVPGWTVILLRGQLFLAYLFGGISKLNADWLLDATPVRWFLTRDHVTAPLIPYLSSTQLAFVKEFLHQPGLAFGISYAGCLFDLTAGALLLIPRTRWFGLGCMTVFHFTNRFVIFDDIDWFPLLGLLSATIFLEPDWPLRFWGWLRHPRWRSPDWSWFWPGLGLVPGVGALLGWKMRSAPPPAPSSSMTPWPVHWGARFTLIWLLLQGVLPMRHFLIAGDARLTAEGLPFSWRLKADVYQTATCEISIHDPQLLTSPASSNHFSWGNYQGAPLLFRKVDAGRLPWTTLPEMVVLLEPIVGYRILYNPFGAPEKISDESQARSRASKLWRELYGREPERIQTAVAPKDAFYHLWNRLSRRDQSEVSAAFAGSTRTPASAAIQSVLGYLQSQPDGGWGGESGLDAHHGPPEELFSFLRTFPPFLLDGSEQPHGPFLLLEDSEVLDLDARGAGRIREHHWNRGFLHTSPAPLHPPSSIPITVLTMDSGLGVRGFMPQTFVMNRLRQPSMPPRVVWNHVRDATKSKLLHIGYNPFLLRRYALRVAAWWEARYGRRPKVLAATAVSLNRRPFQPVVDPGVDLASTQVHPWKHNAWILDLETPRIPREALSQTWTRDARRP
ncbi:MAG: hypothetical protein FJ404_04570 [Verrucomicrobia bacterium]|nr:hypothetical protein [Verrucomicrobiota bacterium]